MQNLTWLNPKKPRTTRAEFHLRRALRKEKIRFRYSEIIECKNGREYEVDIILVDAPILIEVDGIIHDAKDRKRKDKRKDRDLTAEGYYVMRFRDWEIWNNLKWVIKTIKKELKTRRIKHNRRSINA